LYLESEAFESDLAYWKHRLSGVAAGLELPTDHPRPPRASFSAKRIPMVLETDVSARLQEFASTWVQSFHCSVDGVHRHPLSLQQYRGHRTGSREQRPLSGNDRSCGLVCR